MGQRTFPFGNQVEKGLLLDWPSKLAICSRYVGESARAWLLHGHSDAVREELHPQRPAALQSAILCEQVRILYETPAVLLINLINATLVAYILSDFYPVWLVVAWLASFVVVVSTRLLNSWCYHRQPQSPDTAASWALRFAIGSTVTGFLWGLTASVVPITGDPIYQAFIAFVVGGMTSGAVMSSAAYLPAIFGFALPALIPLILVFFAHASLMSATMGLMTTVYAAGLGLLSDRTNGWIISVARHKIIQADLTADLEKNVAAIEYRNKLFGAVSLAARNLLVTSTLDQALPKALEIVGKAVHADHVLLIELQHTAGAERLSASQCHWRSPEIPVPLNFTPCTAIAPETIAEDPWFAPLRGLEAVAGITRTMDAGPAKTLLESLGISSILVEPLVVDAKYRGHIGFGDCKTEREWTSVEIDCLRTLADMIGGSLIREDYIDELKNAERIVERSPNILFRLGGDPSVPLIYVSQNVAALGYDPAGLIGSREFYKSFVHPDDAAKLSHAASQVLLQGNEPTAVELRGCKQDGSYRWFDVHYRPIRDPAGRLIEVEGIMTDITERKESEERIALLARTDSLTGLANRATFHDCLKNAFAAARHGASRFAVLYIDLDRFKEVNDTLGHSAGDLLLKSTAERLKATCRESDCVARLGGDEFAILQTGISDVSDAATLVSKIHDVLAAPHQLGDSNSIFSASIGVSVYTDQTVGSDELLTQADLALCRAKEGGRNQFYFHSEDLDRKIDERVSLTKDLRTALTNNELELYYQPQVELFTGRIAGMEALIRWNHPTRGLLKPADFLPIAEKTGVIVALGQWVLDQACEQMSTWRSAGISPQTLAVNVSIGQLRTRDEFFRSVITALAKWGHSPEDLELDVTESMLARVTLAQNDVLNRLQQRGVTIAIDDFGTRYSSLDYLKTYRVGRVKIPRAMIEAATRDRYDSALGLELINSFALVMG